MQPVAVVTGASSGIGAATAAQLAGAGYHVVLAARRADRLEQAAARARERGGSAQTELLDVTDTAAVAAFARSLDRCDVLVNNAGGAIGMEDVADADPADWQAMFEVNVLGSLHLTKALLPLLIASGDGAIVMLTSTAGFITYEGGGGYAAAKHAQHAMAGTLRLELCGQPVRVIEIAPGMVRTDEFAVNRFRGDADKAAAVYTGRPRAADRRRHRRRDHLGGHPPRALQRGSDGAPPARPGRAAQGLPRSRRPARRAPRWPGHAGHRRARPGPRRPRRPAAPGPAAR